MTTSGIWIIIIIATSIISVVIAKQTFEKPIKNNNKQIRKEYDELINTNEQIRKEYRDLVNAKKQQEEERKRSLDRLDSEISHKYTELDLIDSKIRSQNERIKNEKKIIQEASEERRKNLEKDYQRKKEELEQALKQKQASAQEKIDTINAELQSLKNTKAAIIEARQKELALKEQADLYRLNISQNELQDIQLLRSIQFRLTNPRVLSMLIWQTFYQPLAKKKFPIILGDKEVCGIYKITNMKDDKVYIGQSTSMYKRWTQHCRCGLNIDTPQGNKLYAAMLEDGLENFTFELLEKCSREELDKKEAYYISLYNSVQYGYNSVSGNKKGQTK